MTHRKLRTLFAHRRLKLVTGERIKIVGRPCYAAYGAAGDLVVSDSKGRVRLVHSSLVDAPLRYIGRIRPRLPIYHPYELEPGRKVYAKTSLPQQCFDRQVGLGSKLIHVFKAGEWTVYDFLHANGSHTCYRMRRNQLFFYSLPEVGHLVDCND